MPLPSPNSIIYCLLYIQTGFRPYFSGTGLPIAYMLSWKRGRETGVRVCVSAATSYWLLSATYTYGCLQSHAVAGRGLTQSARSRLRNSLRHVPRHRRGHAVRKYTLHDNAAANSTLSRVAYSKSDHIDRVVTSQNLWP